jgi:hypothetical protein
LQLWNVENLETATIGNMHWCGSWAAANLNRKRKEKPKTKREK